MKKSILNEINSLFETGEIQTIKFSKTGKTTVKYVKEPKLIQYSKCDNILQVIKEHAELSKSLEKVEMNPKLKLTVAEIENLNVIAEEVDYSNPTSYTCEGTFTMPSDKQNEIMQRLCYLANESMINIEVQSGSFKVVENTDQEPKNKGLFESFYDKVGDWLGGGKSFAPDECKSFA